MKTPDPLYWQKLRAKSLAKNPLKRSPLISKPVKLKPISEKRNSISNLIQKAVTVFHKWVKNRDGSGGIFICASCGKVGDSKEAHAGHFINAGNHSIIRFNEFNVWLQCIECNILKHGNFENYRIRLINKIGLVLVEELEQLSKQPFKWDRLELLEIIEKYQRLNNN